MENVLVTAIGSFAADITIKNLKKNKYTVVGCDIYPKEWIADAYQVKRFFKVPLVKNKEEYIESIKAICVSENIKYIIPLTDIEVDELNENRSWFHKKGIILCISSEETLEICRNKYKLASFIKGKLEINTIDTQLLKKVIKPITNFPVVCKPVNGRSSQGLKYIFDNSEWDFHTKDLDKDNYIVQPYIEGAIITVDVIRHPSTKQVVTVARKELLRTANGAGTSVYIFSDEKLTKIAVDLANYLNVKGCVNFEFILDNNNEYHFIECNPRFSGGLEFSCIAGYDFVTNHIKAFSQESIDNEIKIKHQYIARKYEEYVTKINE